MYMVKVSTHACMHVCMCILYTYINMNRNATVVSEGRDPIQALSTHIVPPDTVWAWAIAIVTSPRIGYLLSSAKIADSRALFLLCYNYASFLSSSDSTSFLFNHRITVLRICHPQKFP